MGANATPHEPKRSAWNELIRLKKCELMKKTSKVDRFILENIPEAERANKRFFSAVDHLEAYSSY